MRIITWKKWYMISLQQSFLQRILKILFFLSNKDQTVLKIHVSNKGEEVGRTAKDSSE